MTELPIPPDERTDGDAREIARVWAAHGKQHVTLDLDLWTDPAMWGMCLVDLARHVANAFQDLHGQRAEDVLARIRQGFDAEWEGPTDTPTGSFIQ